MIKEKTFKVFGMHCASCELLIEKKLLELPDVQAAEASVAQGQVTIEYEGQLPEISHLNKLFQKEEYLFAQVDKQEEMVKTTETDGDYSALILVMAGLFLVMVFIILSGLGLAEKVRVDTTSSLPLFVLLGLMAGVSSCAALVGGMILSMSKQWLELYHDGESLLTKLQPHFLFNLGRLVAFALFGALLGLVGAKLQLSFGFTSFLVIAVSFLMILLGLQMLGVRSLQRFQFSLPKNFTRFAANEKNFQGKQMPFLMGAFTFFLPCGFTLTAQGLALLSGSALQGSLIMLAFASGTTLPLLLIGLSSIKLSGHHFFSSWFPKLAGLLVLFFAVFNLNNQLNVLGISSLSDWRSVSVSQSKESDLVPLVGGKQVIKMEASSRGYSPNYFKVRANLPVRWEITDVGTSGCTNAVIAKGLFVDQINLIPGQTSVKEFTPAKVGRYKFSCWMGMISGMIEVVGEEGSLSKIGQANAALSEIPSGAKGCGCGGGGSGSCGAQ